MSFKCEIKMDRRISLLIVVAIIVSLVYFAAVYNNANTIQLSGVQITNYHGQKLTPINDIKQVSIKGTQYINISNYTLQITGLVQDPKNLTYAQVLNHTSYQKVVTLNCVEGWSATVLWKGVLVSDLLNEAKPLPSANTVIFYAADNYTTSLPIEYLYIDQILLAYNMNNVTLPAQYGYPFMLVAQSKWGYKWIKWVTKIEVTNNSSYEGYWESNGYSNSGDLNQSFLTGGQSEGM